MNSVKYRDGSAIRNCFECLIVALTSHLLAVVGGNSVVVATIYGGQSLYSDHFVVQFF
jgi:hypothetical protein